MLQNAVTEGSAGLDVVDGALVIEISVVAGNSEVLVLISRLEVLVGRISVVVEFAGGKYPLPEGTYELVEFGIA